MGRGVQGPYAWVQGRRATSKVTATSGSKNKQTNKTKTKQKTNNNNKKQTKKWESGAVQGPYAWVQGRRATSKVTATSGSKNKQTNKTKTKQKTNNNNNKKQTKKWGKWSCPGPVCMGPR